MPTLYVASIPITGNYKETSQEVIDKIKASDFVIGEERRNVLTLLAASDARDKEYYLLNEHSKDDDRLELLQHLFNSNTATLFTDNGTPCLSDPDFDFVRLCRDNSVTVKSIGATSSITAAISISGLDCTKFNFLSFPPIKKDERKRFFHNIITRGVEETSIFMERPYALQKVLEELSDLKSKIFLGVNLSMENEFSIYATAKEILKKPKIPKSPFIIIIPKISEMF